MGFRLAALALVLCVFGYGQDNLRLPYRYVGMTLASLYTPDCSATSQTPPNPGDASPEDFVELERSMCFSECPAYRVRLYRTGEIEWQSRQGWRAGEEIFKAMANVSEAEAMLNRIYGQEFWSACESYPAGEDTPTYDVRVSIGGQRKTVRFSAGSGLDWLDELTTDLDRVVETHRWLYGDPAMGDLDHMLSEFALSKRGLTPLMKAATTDNIGAIAELLAAGAPVDDQDASGWTALMYAAGTYQPKAVSALLEAGADPNHTDLAGRTPLMAGAYGAGFEELLPVTGNINHQSQAGLGVLMVLAGRANAEKVRLALSAGADSTLTNSKGQTAWDYLMQSYCGRVLAPGKLSRLPEPSAEGKQQCFELDRLLRLPAQLVR